MAFSDRLANLGEKCGLEKKTRAHAWRHTSITFQVMGGMSLAQVQGVARHTTMAMTEGYFDATQMPISGVTEAVVTVLNRETSSEPKTPPPRGKLRIASEHPRT
jgi:site-specific recombinase XerD